MNAVRKRNALWRPQSTVRRLKFSVVPFSDIRDYLNGGFFSYPSAGVRTTLLFVCVPVSFEHAVKCSYFSIVVLHFFFANNVYECVSQWKHWDNGICRLRCPIPCWFRDWMTVKFLSDIS